MKGRLEYDDHNDEFRKLLPVTGSATPAPPPSDSTHRWFIVEPDAALVYQGHTCRQLLIASRWKDVEVGDRNPAAVFVLRVHATTTVARGWSVRAFPHVAWGRWHVADAANRD